MVEIKFMSSKDTDEDTVIHPKSDNIEIMINHEADEIIERLFQSLLTRCQIRFETSMKDRDFIFDCTHLLNHKLHKNFFKRDGSYIDSTNWIKNKKARIYLIDKNNKKTFNAL